MCKKLYRSSTDKQIAGVCGGIAEYFNIDPTIVRLLWAFISLAYGTGIIAYIVCAIVIPERPKD
ncbi:MAG: PspC domain-containing protein [Tissierellia bacterium]|nr:PspC domain-containing protein [Tissierellia bacterium]